MPQKKPLTLEKLYHNIFLKRQYQIFFSIAFRMFILQDIKRFLLDITQ